MKARKISIFFQNRRKRTKESWRRFSSSFNPGQPV